MVLTGFALARLANVFPVYKFDVSFRWVFFCAMRGVGNVMATSANDDTRESFPMLYEFL
jgi:hypothetical protein